MTILSLLSPASTDPPISHPVPSLPARSLADKLVLDLAALGISTYFGVPGGAIEPLFNALARHERTRRVRVVPMRSEAGAAFAADGYYRATGRMAVCTGTTGPGIANMLTAAMAAHADRIPMLLFTPDVPLAKHGRGALQESSSDGYDLPRILSAVTRYSTTVTHPDQLPHKLAQAFARAGAAPAGPVHLSIPSDILAGRPYTATIAPIRAAPQITDPNAVAELTHQLTRAARPVFYIGDDAGEAAERVFRLAHLLDAPVVSSPAGKRWIGHLDPAYAGVLGFSGHQEAQRVTRAADLVVAFGATFDELSTNAWTVFPDLPIYAVDRHLHHAHRHARLVPIIAETTHVIDGLLTRFAERPRSSRRRRIMPPVRTRIGGPDDPVHPTDLMTWLSAALPPEVVVHVDAGNGFSWSTHDLIRPRPDTYRVAMGLSTMCWAIGAVIGAVVARPQRTVCITGDGAFLMSSLELTVAVEQQLPVTYVILNDAGLGMVRHGQRLAQAESIAHTITPVRFDRLAQACGARGMRIRCAADLDRVPRAWLASDLNGPCVIDVCIDPDAVPPMADRVLGLALGASR